MATFNISTLLNLQHQYNTRACYIIGSLVFISQVIFAFLFII